MAAGEDQLEPFVGDGNHRITLLRLFLAFEHVVYSGQLAPEDRIAA
jgi:hypothetical protein